MKISQAEALKIARDDASRAYSDLSIYAVSIESRDDVWHVEYRIADPLTLGGGPTYKISQRTGEILSRQYDQ